ncbi:unnamed protein product [Adineta steineri]|uniref:G-protein coupled receptors family 1 profile domain-containing protein n=1 Tax=Adineta steineri TaxID=433720 RepID=A0A819E9S8_9BILA|nr:unnamed protein product [Adineta steineri]CAF3848018.1 unnamed protein product [Adineta steineri]
MSLTYIGQQFTIYGGMFFLIGGLIGNSTNILVFSNVRTYRRTPCTFYFLTASIANIIYMSFNFTTRIYGSIYGIDFTSISTNWCKIRQFLIMIFSMITLTCSCLATIDQFLATSKNIRLRRLSNIKWSHRIVFIIVILWFLHAIPSLFFFDISLATKKCGAIHPVYAVYNRIYLLGLLCFIPMTITIIFGCFTYRNIRMTRGLIEQNVDRQLAKMTLFQVILIIFSLTPYSINSIYGLVTENFVKDTNQLTKENFITTIVTVITYSYYSGTCYIFWFSSDQFRRKVKRQILFWRRTNHITPSDAR